MRSENSLRVIKPQKNGGDAIKVETKAKATITKVENGWMVNIESDTQYKPGLGSVIQIAIIVLAMVMKMALLLVFPFVALVVVGVQVNNRVKEIDQLLANSVDVVSKELGETEKSSSDGDYRACPSCAEPIRIEAIKCRFCGLELPH